MKNARKRLKREKRQDLAKNDSAEKVAEKLGEALSVEEGKEPEDETKEAAAEEQ